MKIIYKWAVALSCILLWTSCNDEWKDEQYEQYISFVNCGVNKVYLKYNAEGGNKTYSIPIQLSGSTKVGKDVNVTVALDTDTLATYNDETYRLRTDLYYKELDEQHYNFKSWSTTISDGKTKGYLDVDFNFAGLDNYDKYILPLTIDESSDLRPNPVKHYRKSLMQIVLFNDYSGKYEMSSEVVEVGNEKEKLKVENRNSFVIDENTIFFFAGMVDESALDRKDYRINVKFIKQNPDDTSGVLEMWADNDAIDFKWEKAKCFFIIQEEMDAVQPYLKRRYLTMNVSYTYKDLANPAYPITYKYEGTMIMERVLNILMPEEDQIMW
ncbi:DUF4973 domain-containing protein [Bacteroides sp. 224]|uniref:DUF4973 domain-containing protein n=1 Tax=Bacteroides sp. 224 TaxID=2302936 RepID=UPI0013D2640F|nr:DUF4973 domain-containing protein [Bacteroides sp. 224]NDV66587.1 DUF4973 domain-containing protein [Bacteroides sp. 224]